VNSRQHRAEPLAPDDRRRAIIKAVLPLLVAEGPGVTTRQLAAAAGIAEGTIFRVFPDKHALIHEAIKVSMDPAPVQQALSEIHSEATLQEQMTEAARILIERFDEVIALVSSLRNAPPIGPNRPPGPPPFIAEANTAINHSLTELFERHEGVLRIKPARAAALFRGLVFASVHPAFGPTERQNVNEIVDVLISGIIDHDREPAL